MERVEEKGRGEGIPPGPVNFFLIRFSVMAAARTIAEADPYYLAGLFEKVEVKAWNWVFNNPANGPK